MFGLYAIPIGDVNDVNMYVNNFGLYPPISSKFLDLNLHDDFPQRQVANTKVKFHSVGVLNCHFRLGFSLTKTIHQLGYPQFRTPPSDDRM